LCPAQEVAIYFAGLKNLPKLNLSFKVPDIARLMDQSVIKRTQDTRHRVELMFRSSINNEDRAKILNHNNPIPNFNNLEGDESIDRYLPSWAPDDVSRVAFHSHTEF
jgi:hypothetical protein